MAEEVKHPIPWEHAKDHVHACIWEDEWGYEKWTQLRELCDSELGWEYDGTCDIKECDTWRCLVECLAKHKGCEWDKSCEVDLEVPLDYDPYLSD